MSTHTFSTDDNPALFLEQDDGSGAPERLAAGSTVLVRNADDGTPLDSTTALDLGYLSFTTTDVQGVQVSGDNGATWKGPFWSKEAREAAVKRQVNLLSASGVLVAGITNPVIDTHLGGDATGLVPAVAGKVAKGALAVSASDYCIEDGTSDEITGLTAAVAAAKASRSKILTLTPGITYRTSAGLAAAGITVRAYGATIKPLDGKAAFIPVNLAGAGDTVWQGGTIECNKANVASGSAVGLYVAGAFSSVTLSDVTVKDATSHGIQVIAPTVITDPANATSGPVKLTNCTATGATTYGIMVSRCAEVTIDHCTATGNSNGGITATLCRGVEFTGCTASTNGAHGILVMYSSDVTFNGGNRCNGNSQSGICMGGGSATNTASTFGAISGNICSSNTQHGIQLDTTVTAGSAIPWHGAVTGNTCSQNGIHGIYANNTSDVAINGNTCRSNGSNGIMCSAEDLSISGNTLTGNQSRGLAIFNFGSGVTIGVNTSRGNTTANYYVDSTATPAPIFATTSTAVPS